MTRPTPAILTVALGLLFTTGCEPDPCSDYVDYMCDCHGDEIDCASYENTYENADQDLQDQCALALEDQEDEDAANGEECDVTST